MRTMRVALVAGAGVGAMVAGAAADEIQVLTSGNFTCGYDTETGVTGPLVYITGLAPREDVLAIDTNSYRLYGLTRQRLYRIDGATGAASPVGPQFSDPPIEFLWTADIGFDFAPSSKVARILLGTKPPGAGPYTGSRSLTLDATTLTFDDHDPQTHTKYPLAYAEGDPGAGSAPVVLTLTQFSDPAADGATRVIGVDSARNALVQIGAVGSDPSTAEGNLVTTIAPLSGLTDGERIGSLDLSRDSSGATALILTHGGHDVPYSFSTRIYSVDLATGVLTQLPDIEPTLPSGTSLIPIDIAPVGAGVSAPPALDIRRFDAKIRTSTLRGSSATLVGKIDVPAGGWEGRMLSVDFGGTVRRFELDRFGRGVSGRDSFRVGRKPKDGGWQFTLRLYDVDADALYRLSAPTGTVSVLVDVFVRAADELAGGDLTYRTPIEADFYPKGNRIIFTRHVR